MRRIMLALATVTVLVAIPSQAWGQYQVGPYLAFHDDADLGVGAFVGIPLPSIHEDLSFVGDFGFFFPGNGGHDGRDADYWEANAGALFRFPLPDLSFTPWVLGGLNLAHGTVGRWGREWGDFSGSDTEIGLNLGGGITFGAGPMSPFVGAKFELGGGKGAVIFAGLSFTVGNGGQ